MRDLRPIDFRGRWTAELTPDSVIALTGVRLGRPLVGSIHLTQRDTTSRVAVYVGTYDADLRVIGLARPTGETLVSVPRGDTVRVILDPTVDHGNIEMVGRCRSGRLVGKWVRTGAPARAWGHFTLRRSPK